MNIRVNLTRRVRLDGVDRYCPVVVSANGRLKPDWIVVDAGKPSQRRERVTGGRFYLDWTEHGKRKRLGVGTNAADANALWMRKQAELQAKAQGVAVLSDATEDGAGKIPLILAIAEFLEEMKLSRKEKTHSGYEIALRYFQESCAKRFVEDVERIDILKFAAFLKTDRKQAPRSVHNKVACVTTFLERNGVTKLLRRGDRPRFVNQEVEIYEADDLEKLYAVCTPYHVTLYKFLLMTGLREKEAMYCQWNDVNFKAGTVNMRYKPQYEFDPKAYREREVPIPDKLVSILKKFKPSDAKGTELLFHTESGRPDTHMLRALKRNAVRAGLDPERYWLHKFRATFATSHLGAGVDLRTVQAWLGHTNLESTIRYLKPARAEAVRDKVNATFV